jgi:hypothetical protein
MARSRTALSRPCARDCAFDLMGIGGTFRSNRRPVIRRRFVGHTARPDADRSSFRSHDIQIIGRADQEIAWDTLPCVERAVAPIAVRCSLGYDRGEDRSERIVSRGKPIAAARPASGGYISDERERPENADADILSGHLSRVIAGISYGYKYRNCRRRRNGRLSHRRL